MKIRYLKLKNWLLISLAGVLGINLSCSGGVEYGCPKADFKVNDSVTDSDGNSVQDIDVERGRGDTKTSSDGSYESRIYDDPDFPVSYDDVFSDIDGD
ncbi:MAG: hypothetical protein J6X86_01410 [Bacteroidales bacterium]|nr:hypothetical protein [Bacteroidales bacterium]